MTFCTIPQVIRKRSFDQVAECSRRPGTRWFRVASPSTGAELYRGHGIMCLFYPISQLA